MTDARGRRSVLRRCAGTATVLAPEDFAIVVRALETVNHERSLTEEGGPERVWGGEFDEKYLFDGASAQVCDSSAPWGQD